MVRIVSTIGILVLSLSLSAQTKKSVLALYDFRSQSVQQFQLPKQLNEISGLAATADGRLFAHNDEEGDIFHINVTDGSIVKKFSLGSRNVREDFEGTAIVGNTFYMVTSNGTIYQCREGAHGERVQYNIYETPLSKEYDVEGLCYDPKTNSLLLACKGYSGISHIGFKAVFSFSLAAKKLEQSPRFLISLQEIEKKLGDKPFHPSGIEYNAQTGTFFILDSQIKSVIEIDPDGTILHEVMLTKRLHRQPEGITILPDGTLCVSDEGAKHGTLSLYKRKK